MAVTSKSVTPGPIPESVATQTSQSEAIFQIQIQFGKWHLHQVKSNN